MRAVGFALMFLLLAPAAFGEDANPQWWKPDAPAPAASTPPPVIINRPIVVKRVIVRKTVVARPRYRRRRCAFLFFGCR